MFPCDINLDGVKTFRLIPVQIKKGQGYGFADPVTERRRSRFTDDDPVRLDGFVAQRHRQWIVQNDGHQCFGNAFPLSFM